MVKPLVQVHSVSPKAAGERVRIQLKEIETLSYSCTSSEDLQQLHHQLKNLKSEFQSKLPHLEGIVLRPAVSHALKVKRKYAHITRKRQLKYCSVLSEAKGRRKTQLDSCYRNRVGAKAERLRKVCSIILMHTILHIVLPISQEAEQKKMSRAYGYVGLWVIKVSFFWSHLLSIPTGKRTFLYPTCKLLNQLPKVYYILALLGVEWIYHQVYIPFTRRQQKTKKMWKL